MNLDNRQKILIGSFAAMLFLWQGSGVLWSLFFGPFDTRYASAAALDAQLQKKRDEKFQLDLTERRTRIWERRSLPSNPVVASTLYHHWVLDLAGKHKLEKLTVTPKRLSTGVTNAIFTRIPVTVTAECKMEQLCQFLYDFYRTDLLQKVTHLAVESTDFRANPTLKVTLDLEGLSLASAKNRNTLFADKQEAAVSEAMAKKSLADYQTLTDANRFVRGYNGPPKPPTPPGPPPTPFDATPYILLVAVINDGEPQAWLYDQTSNKQTVLRQKQDFEISGVKGHVLEIDPQFVRVKVNEKEWQLDLGKNVKQMIEIKTAAPATTSPAESVPAADLPKKPAA